MSPVQVALLAILAALLVLGAASDVRHRTLPNRLTGAVALLAIAWWAAAGLGWPAIGLQLLLGLGALLLFSLAFARGMMGGGDVKLIAALALWLPPWPFARMLVWMAIGGGVLTLWMLVRHRLARAAGQPEIPYGVAIVAATLLVMANDILTSPTA